MKATQVLGNSGGYWWKSGLSTPTCQIHAAIQQTASPMLRSEAFLDLCERKAFQVRLYFLASRIVRSAHLVYGLWGLTRLQSNWSVRLSLVFHVFYALVFFRKPAVPRMLVQDTRSLKCTSSVRPGTSSSLGRACCITGTAATSELWGITAHALAFTVILLPAMQRSQRTVRSTQPHLPVA